MDDPTFSIDNLIPTSLNTPEVGVVNFHEPAGTTYTMGVTDFEMTNHQLTTIKSESNGL